MTGGKIFQEDLVLHGSQLASQCWNEHVRVEQFSHEVERAFRLGCQYECRVDLKGCTEVDTTGLVYHSAEGSLQGFFPRSSSSELEQGFINSLIQHFSSQMRLTVGG